MQHPDVREILLIGFYPQSQEMNRFRDDMQRTYGLPIRQANTHTELVEISHRRQEESALGSPLCLPARDYPRLIHV